MGSFTTVAYDAICFASIRWRKHLRRVVLWGRVRGFIEPRLSGLLRVHEQWLSAIPLRHGQADDVFVPSPVQPEHRNRNEGKIPVASGPGSAGLLWHQLHPGHKQQNPLLPHHVHTQALAVLDLISLLPAFDVAFYSFSVGFSNRSQNLF